MYLYIVVTNQRVYYRETVYFYKPLDTEGRCVFCTYISASIYIFTPLFI